MIPTITITEALAPENFPAELLNRRRTHLRKKKKRKQFQEIKTTMMFRRAFLAALDGNQRIMDGPRKHNLRDVVLQRNHWLYITDETSAGAYAQIRKTKPPTSPPPRRSVYVGLKPATIDTRTEALINV